MKLQKTISTGQSTDAHLPGANKQKLKNKKLRKLKLLERKKEKLEALKQRKEMLIRQILLGK